MRLNNGHHKTHFLRLKTCHYFICKSFRLNHFATHNFSPFLPSSFSKDIIQSQSFQLPVVPFKILVDLQFHSKSLLSSSFPGPYWKFCSHITWLSNGNFFSYVFHPLVAESSFQVQGLPNPYLRSWTCLVGLGLM